MVFMLLTVNQEPESITDVSDEANERKSATFGKMVTFFCVKIEKLSLRTRPEPRSMQKAIRLVHRMQANKGKVFDVSAERSFVIVRVLMHRHTVPMSESTIM